MAIQLINDWKSIEVKNIDTGVLYGESLPGGVLGAIQVASSIASYSVELTAEDAIKVGIYKGSDNNLYFFSSSEACDTVKSGTFTLLASGTASPTSTIGIGATTDPVGLSSINLTLSDAAGVPLGLSGASILSLTGSAGDDRVIVSGTNKMSMTGFDFSQGGADKIYFTNDKSKVTFDTAKASTGTKGSLSFIASADGSTESAVAVVNGDMTTATLSGDATGTKVNIKLGGDATQTLRLLSSSGAVTVTGDTIATFKADSVLGGALTVTGSSIMSAVEIGTVAGGGSAAITAGGTNAAEALSAKFKLVAGTGTYAATTNATLTITETSGKFTVTNTSQAYAIDTSALVTGGSFIMGDLTLASGSKLNSALYGSNSIGGMNAQTLVGAVVAAGKAFNFEGAGSDVISFKSLGDNAKVTVGGGTDTLSVAKFGAGSEVVLRAESGAANGYLTLSSGSTVNNIITSSASMMTASEAAVFAGSITGGSTVKGSSGDDQFLFNLTNTDAVATIEGGAGNDVYNMVIGSSSKGATISDFGWSDASGNALSDSLGSDILVIQSDDPTTMANIKLVGTTVKFGGDAITAAASSVEDGVFMKIGKTAESAKLYKVTDKGASAFESDTAQDVVGTTVAGGGTEFDASNTAHAYIDAASGANTVKGFATYDGTNDNVASILNGNNVTVDNAQLSTDTDGSVLLKDAEGANSIKLNGVEPGKMIKMGDTKTDTQAVYLASTGTNALTADQLETLNDHKGVILGQGTGTKIDLGGTKAGTINGDDAMYKNIGGILGSTEGGSLLNAGSGSVNLVSQADGDTMDGGTGSVANVLTASGNKTTFALHEGIGKDTISSFGFGPDTTTADVVDFGSGIALSTDNVTLGSGKLTLGSGSDSYEIKAASGVDQAVVRYSGGGSNGGAILADLSSGGSADLDYLNGVNIVMGRGEKTTLTVGAGDTVAAERANEPSGIGWNSMILTDDVGTIDGTNSSMTAFNGEGGYANVVKASTVVGADKTVWLCGGLEDGFADSANDTLVATGNGNNQIFVGAKMGNDVLQGVSSGDTITFIDTKISDYVNDITDLISVSGTGFSVDFAGAGTVNGGTGTAVITGTLTTSADKVTNLVFHFDSDGTGAANDYRWDGQSLVAITSTATA